MPARQTLLALLLLPFHFPSALPQENPTPAFEQPGILPASLFFPPEVLQNSGYSVDPHVYNDGVYNTWRVLSDYGTFEVLGNERLLLLLREIAAIAAIRSQSNIVRYGEGVMEAGAGTAQAALNIIRNPVQTARKLPIGASRFLGRVGQTLDHAATGTLDLPDGGGQLASRLIGVDSTKRRLAAQLGVNPYSRNAALQSALDDAAWSLALGRVTLKVGTSLLLPFAATATMSGVNIASTLTSEQIAASPAELTASVQAQLTTIGVSTDNATALLENPEYDPWTLAALANGLTAVGATSGNDAFVSRAAEASTEADAYYFLRAAQILADYSRTTPIPTITAGELAILARDANDRLIVPLWADYLEWTPHLNTAASNLAADISEGKASGALLDTTATLSPAAAEGLALTGVAVHSASPARPAP